MYSALRQERYPYARNNDQLRIKREIIMILFILTFIYICSDGATPPPKASLWSEEKRFNRLMEITKGGSKYTKIEINDFQHLILDGIQAEQVTEFTIVATFNGLAPQFACHLCKRANLWMPLIVKNTIQGEGKKKIFYVWLDYSEKTKNAFSVLQLQMVPAWFIFNEDVSTLLTVGYVCICYRERCHSYPKLYQLKHSMSDFQSMMLLRSSKPKKVE